MELSLRVLLRALAVGGAGLGTFYVAAQWSRTAMEPGPGEEIVRPAVPASAPAAPVPEQRQAGASAAGPAVAGVPAAAASRALPSSEGQAFARLSWAPRPPPVASPPPPAPVVPTAPPLPFSFVGMVENGMGKPQAFLAKGDALLVVSAGELLDNNTYRVDSFDATRVVITYLPLSMKQTIEVSGGSR